MQEIIDLVSRKTLHRFSYVANFFWIVLEIILSAIFLDIENSDSRFDFHDQSGIWVQDLKLTPPSFTGFH